MVFLRLTVKILPREQLSSASSSFSIRSILGDRNREDVERNHNGMTGRAVGFLIPLQNPEDVTLGALAGMIQEKWKKLRPDHEPLEIKKLVDDHHDQGDLDVDLTVADVFVDNGKAISDGSDQRATVIVIQKPTSEAPTRYASVDQDWATAALDYERIKRELKKPPKFNTIEEETCKYSLTDSYLSERHSSTRHTTSDNGSASRLHQDVPVRSVERDEPALLPSPPRWDRESPVLVQDSQEKEVAATPQGKRLESKELGDSPTPNPPPKTLPPVIEENPSYSINNPPPPTPGPLLKTPATSRQPQQGEVDENSSSRRSSRGPGSKSSPKAVYVDEDVEMTDIEPNSSPARRGVSPVVVIDHSEQKTLFSETSMPTAKRKRKSGDNLTPKKEPRLELSKIPSSTRTRGILMVKDNEDEPPASPSPRKRDRVPSFSSPQRRPSIGECPADSTTPGLGLGITQSPRSKKSQILGIQNGESSGKNQSIYATPLFPRSTSSDRRSSLENNTPSKVLSPGIEQVKKLASAMRKDSPSDRNQLRRSVSFAEETEIVTPMAAPPPRTTPRTGTQLSKVTPTSAPKSSAPAAVSSTPARSQSCGVVWPPGIPQETIRQFELEAKEKEDRENKERAEWERKIAAAKAKDGNAKIVALLEDAFTNWTEIKQIEKNLGKSGRSRLKKLEKELLQKQELIQEHETNGVSSNVRGKVLYGQKTQPENNTPSSIAQASKPKSSTTTPAGPGPAPATRNNGPAKSLLQNALSQNDIPPSSILSDDNNLPPTDKIREETKGKMADASRATTTAKRTITKIEPDSSEMGSVSDSDSEPGSEDSDSSDFDSEEPSSESGSDDSDESDSESGSESKSESEDSGSEYIGPEGNEHKSDLNLTREKWITRFTSKKATESDSVVSEQLSPASVSSTTRQLHSEIDLDVTNHAATKSDRETTLKHSNGSDLKADNGVHTPLPVRTSIERSTAEKSPSVRRSSFDKPIAKSSPIRMSLVEIPVPAKQPSVDKAIGKSTPVKVSSVERPSVKRSSVERPSFDRTSLEKPTPTRRSSAELALQPKRTSVERTSIEKTVAARRSSIGKSPPGKRPSSSDLFSQPKSKSPVATNDASTLKSINGWTPVNNTNSSVQSSQPRPQSRSQLSNRASQRTNLKSLKAQMQDAMRETRQNAPKTSERTTRPPRKSIFDFPGDSASSDGENESESNSDSGDDNRGDILPTGASQTLRNTQPPKRQGWFR